MRKSSEMKPRPTPFVPRAKVLVVLHADGYVEAFGERHIDVHIANRLHVEDERGNLSTRIDEYTESTLPRCYRPLYLPSNLRAIGSIETTSPEAALDSLYDLSIIRALRGERKRPTPTRKLLPRPAPRTKPRPVVINVKRRRVR